MLTVVKIGSSSVVDQKGHPNGELINHLCRQINDLRNQGHAIVLVSSGAVALGSTIIKNLKTDSKDDIAAKQALAAVGQFELMSAYNKEFSDYETVTAQVLLTPTDFMHRRQYLTAKSTLETLLAMNILPIINENDAVATDEIRFGDNDRIAALVANMLGANLLVLLTDTTGMYTADPSIDENATLIKEITDLTDQINKMASETSSSYGSGGMVAKLAAAKIASWSGVKVVIGSAGNPTLLTDAVGEKSVDATVIHPKSEKLAARKLWIAFAKANHGTVVIDDGAVTAIVELNKSLLPNGVTECRGEFVPGEAIEVLSSTQELIAKGLSKMSSQELAEFAKRKSLGETYTVTTELIHRDDLVLLAGN